MGIEATLIHEYVTPERYYFDRGAKRPKICYLTRKERSAAWLHQVLYAKGDPFSRFEWMPLRELSEDEYARNLREATVYVTTNMQEGMNTSVLEAMACGCLVVGYSGVGGAVYMKPEGPSQNCILVENGNVPALGRRLESVLRDLADRARTPMRGSRKTGLKRPAPTATRKTKPKAWGQCFRLSYGEEVKRPPPTPRPTEAFRLHRRPGWRRPR